MEKKTIIYEAESMDDPVMEPESGTPAAKAGPVKESDHKYLKTGIIASAGLAAGVLGSCLAFKPDSLDLNRLFEGDDSSDSYDVEIMVDKNLPIATHCKDSMSFEEAFRIAREEVGRGGLFMWNGQLFGTYSETEWGNLSDEEQKEFWGSFSISPYGEVKAATEYDFTNLQIASSVHDNMSFGEAFMTARDEVGSVGVFYWHGRPYNTFNKEEWEALPGDEKDDYLSKIIEVSHDDSPRLDQYNYSENYARNENLNMESHGQVFIAEPLNLANSGNDNIQYAVSSDNEEVLIAGIPDQDNINIEFSPIESISGYLPESALPGQLELDKLSEKNAEYNEQIHQLQEELERRKFNVHDLSKLADIGQKILDVGVNFGLVPGMVSNFYSKVCMGTHTASDVSVSLNTLHDNPQ